MSKIIVNGKYLAETRYRGSGFHSYLQALIRAWEKGSHHEYHILLPEKTITVEEATRDYLSMTPSSITFHTLPCHRSRFEDVLSDQGFLSEYHADHLFFPHMELPHHPPSIPYSVVIHDIIPTLFLTPSYLLRGKTPLGMITRQGITDYFHLRRHLSSLQNIVAISETTRQSLLTVFGDKHGEKIRVINPIAGKNFQVEEGLKPHSRDQILEKYGLQSKKFAIYFGGYTFRKNYRRLVEGFTLAVKRYREVNGDGVSFPIPTLVMAGGKGKITQAPDILPLPKLPEEELRTLISEALFSIYPSLFEGFGLPVLESLASGTLPLLSDIPTNREIIPDKIPHLFFNPYHSEAISQSIYHFLKNPEEIILIYDKIKGRIKDFYWEESGKKFDSLFD